MKECARLRRTLLTSTHPDLMMREPIPLECPYCGAPVELDIDESGGTRQHFVQDCPICCQPWEVEILRDRDGDWLATLRTGDE